jgi:hypothetical protein
MTSFVPDFKLRITFFLFCLWKNPLSVAFAVLFCTVALSAAQGFFFEDESFRGEAGVEEF